MPRPICFRTQVRSFSIFCICLCLLFFMISPRALHLLSADNFYVYVLSDLFPDCPLLYWTVIIFPTVSYPLVYSLPSAVMHRTVYA